MYVFINVSVYILEVSEQFFVILKRFLHQGKGGIIMLKSSDTPFLIYSTIPTLVFF